MQQVLQKGFQKTKTLSKGMTASGMLLCPGPSKMAVGRHRKEYPLTLHSLSQVYASNLVLNKKLKGKNKA